jgi:hypothetical protein
MKQNKAKLAVGLTLIVLVGLTVLWLKPAVPPPVALPSPNGYDTLLKAGQMASSESAEFKTLGVEPLRRLVTENEEALRLARQGLTRPCRVPVQFSIDYASNHPAELAPMKRLTRACLAEGLLAERENRWPEAVQAYLDAIRLGHEASRGGLFIDALVGVACRAAGAQALSQICPRLTGPTCRETAHRLEQTLARSEPVSDVIEHERRWSLRTFGWRTRLAGLVMFRSMKKNQQNVVGKLQAQAIAEQRLLIELATRAYALDKGHRPKLVADLVPAYIQTMPRDPRTGLTLPLPKLPELNSDAPAE